MNCPKCGSECWRDEVDIGVGTQYGPWNCEGCGWSQEDELADDLLANWIKQEQEQDKGKEFI